MNMEQETKSSILDLLINERKICYIFGEKDKRLGTKKVYLIKQIAPLLLCENKAPVASFDGTHLIDSSTKKIIFFDEFDNLKPREDVIPFPIGEKVRVNPNCRVIEVSDSNTKKTR